jgi:hypothetical protein
MDQTVESRTTHTIHAHPHNTTTAIPHHTTHTHPFPSPLTHPNPSPHTHFLTDHHTPNAPPPPKNSYARERSAGANDMPSVYAMKLRKHLRGKGLEDVRQVIFYFFFILNN